MGKKGSKKSIGDPSVSKQDLNKALVALGLELDSDQVDRSIWLASELLDWNRRVNLTGISSPEDVISKHLLDSFTLVPVLERIFGAGRIRMVDVGTGAGFPGIPAKLARPDLKLTLLEATGKKVAFLEHAIEGLSLDNTEALHTRAELIGHEPGYREAFDVAVGRAVSGMGTLVELLLPLVRLGGWALVMKTQRELDTELQGALPGIEELGGRVTEIASASIAGYLEDRVIVLVEKVRPTPEAYPRRPGVPQRRPLSGRLSDPSDARPVGPVKNGGGVSVRAEL